MRYTDFFDLIKASALSGVYLLYGEEEYLLLSAIRAVKEKYGTDIGAMNIDSFNSASVEEIIGACETLPFMTEKRIVLCSFIPTGTDADKLLKYFDRLPNSSVLIFCIRGKCDARLSVYKKINKENRTVNFEYLDGLLAAKWAMKRAMELGCSLDSQDARFLVELCGCSCSVLNNEISKLCAISSENGCISKNVISKTVTKNIETTVFTILDYFINGKVSDGVVTLNQQLLNGETSIGLSKLFLSSISQMLAVHSLIESGADNATIKKESGLRFDRTITTVKLMSKAKLTSLQKASLALCDVAPMQLKGMCNGDDALLHALLILAQ